MNINISERQVQIPHAPHQAVNCDAVMSLFDRSQGSQLTVITVSSLLGHECKEASILAALYIARKMRRSPGAGYPGVVVAHTVLSRADLKIKTQYKSYGQGLEELLEQGARKGEQKDEMQLLTLFIEKWEEAHNSFADADPRSTAPRKDGGKRPKSKGAC